MVHIIYICIITFLIGAYVGRYQKFKRLDGAYELLEDEVEEVHNRSEHYRLLSEDLKEKDSVQAYDALDQGMKEISDAYATDMAQYEESLQATEDALVYQLRDAMAAIHHRFFPKEIEERLSSELEARFAEEYDDQVRQLQLKLQSAEQTVRLQQEELVSLRTPPA